MISACSSASAPPAEHEPDAGPAVTPPRPDAPAPMPDSGPTYRYLCSMPPPASAAQPLMPSLPSAGCPALQPGMNTMTSTGHGRDFILVVPANLQPAERPPVLFMWHWIGGNANSFLVKGEVQAAADDQRFIAVIPVARGATVIGTSFNTR